MFRSVYDPSRVQQSFYSNSRVGAPQGRAPSSLPGRLVGHSEVKDPSAAASGSSSPVVEGSGDRCQLGKYNLKPSTHVQYLGLLVDTSLREVLPSEACLARFQAVATSFLLLPSPSAGMWQQGLGHMASLERFP